MSIFYLLAEMTIPFAEITGAAALVIVILYVVFDFVQKFTKKQNNSNKKHTGNYVIENNDIKDIKNDIKEINNDVSELKNQVTVIIAHYESDARIITNIEDSIKKLDKILISGNGNESINTKVALLESKLKDIEYHKPRTRKQ